MRRNLPKHSSVLGAPILQEAFEDVLHSKLENLKKMIEAQTVGFPQCSISSESVFCYS
jgi:hypothetical protein